MDSVCDKSVPKAGATELAVKGGDLIAQLTVVVGEVADALVSEREELAQRGIGCGRNPCVLVGGAGSAGADLISQFGLGV